MTTARSTLVTWTALLCIALPAAAQAPNWQPYLVEFPNTHDIDVNSVRIVDGGLVRFSYRERYSKVSRPSDIGSTIEAVADCKGRRSSDVTRGPPELRAVFEDTKSAYQLDFACRLAGLDFKTHIAATQTTAPNAPADWRYYEAWWAIDANSLHVHDGLVFFRYVNGPGYMTEPDRAVVDCTGRRRSEVAGDRFTLQPISESTLQSPQADLVCQLAHLPSTPIPVPKHADFSLADPHHLGNNTYVVKREGMARYSGLVHFVYYTHETEDGQSMGYARGVPSVVDCDTRRRSDVVSGKFDLQPVRDGTLGATQVAEVCQLATTVPIRPAPASAP